MTSGVMKSGKRQRSCATHRNFFSELFAGTKKERRRYVRYIETLEKLQDELGALNDLVTMPSLLARYGLTDDAAMVKGGGSKKKRLAAAADAHEELADAKRFWR